MSRRTSVRALVWLVLVTVAVAGCASSHSGTLVQAGGQPGSSAPVGAAVTKTRVFAPYDRSGVATTGVVAHRSGSCFTASITVSAASAYRCFAANDLLDPCFVVPGSAHLLDCYADPWSRAIRLRVTRLPKAASSVTVARPWALALADGSHCVATNGTAPIVRHVALSYQCRTGMAGVVGSLHAQPLRVLYRAVDGLVRTVRVAYVWQSR